MEVTGGGAWETAQEITKIAAVPGCGLVECVYSFKCYMLLPFGRGFFPNTQVV